MSLTEFDIIKRYFADPALAFARAGVELGIGDDAALLTVPDQQRLAVTMDTLVAGVHFPDAAEPAALGYKSLAVNLSDLAAMAAEPYFFTLSLVLPEADETWLNGFSQGLAELAAKFNCPLVGGDVTHGPLTITIQAHGLIPEKQAILRSGARPGDRVFVTGHPGDGLLGLAALQLPSGLPNWLQLDQDRLEPQHREALRQAYYRPRPRVEFARRVRDLVSAGIDVSDGLMGDLGHILEASGLGASLHLADLPFSPAARSWAPRDLLTRAALFGGDDYELCVTAPPSAAQQLLRIAEQCQLSLTDIGEIEQEAGLRCLDADGRTIDYQLSAYRHF